jgi:hypothetical protein
MNLTFHVPVLVFNSVHQKDIVMSAHANTDADFEAIERSGVAILFKVSLFGGFGTGLMTGMAAHELLPQLSLDGYVAIGGAVAIFTMTVGLVLTRCTTLIVKTLNSIG